MEQILKELLEKAYAPYSNYKVAAVVVTHNNEIFKGVNVENASYGATICAERNAILNAVTNGHQKGDFKELYVMVDSDKIASPCFICRQVISEFFTNDAQIILMNKDGQKESYTVLDLCPKPFNDEDLK